LLLQLGVVIAVRDAPEVSLDQPELSASAADSIPPLAELGDRAAAVYRVDALYP